MCVLKSTGNIYTQAQCNTRVADHLMSEAVQQQVQAAERRLDLLLWLLCWQPAEGSAAGAPGEVATLQDHSQRVSRLTKKIKEKVQKVGGAVHSPCEG